MPRKHLISFFVFRKQYVFVYVESPLCVLGVGKKIYVCLSSTVCLLWRNELWHQTSNISLCDMLESREHLSREAIAHTVRNPPCRSSTHIWLSSKGMGVRRLCPVVQVLRLLRPPVHINHGVHREIWWMSSALSLAASPEFWDLILDSEASLAISFWSRWGPTACYCSEELGGSADAVSSPSVIWSVWGVFRSGYSSSWEA